MEEIGIEQARKKLGDIVDRARYRGESTLLTNKGQAAAVIVPVEWHAKALAALGGNEQ